MKVEVSLILTLLLTACGTDHKRGSGNHPPMVRDVAAELEQHVNQFEHDYGVSVNFWVGFAKLDHYAGRCTWWSNGARKVEIDPDYYVGLNFAQVEQLVYHELGHCSLDLDHDDSTIGFSDISGQWPKSIMRSWAFNYSESQVYEMHRDHYVEEMRR